MLFLKMIMHNYNRLLLFISLLDYSLVDDQPDNVVSKKGSGGKISERELYSVRLEEEDNELEAALARSRR